MHVTDGRGRIRVPLLPRSVRVACVVVVAALILFFSVVDPPSPGVPTTFLGVGLDKWLHAASYAGLAGSMGYAMLSPDGRLDRRALAVAFVLAAAYGVGIELVQAPLPARAYSPLDAVANAVGAGFGTSAWRLLRAG